MAARVDPDRIDDAAAAISRHPGVTQNYRRNHFFNLWFTIFISSFSRLGLEKTIEILGREAACEIVHPLPTLRLYKSAASDSETYFDAQHQYDPLTPHEIEAVRLLQRDLPLHARPFDVLVHGSGVTAEELLVTAKAMLARGQIRRFCAQVQTRRPGFAASAMLCGSCRRVASMRMPQRLRSIAPCRTATSGLCTTTGRTTSTIVLACTVDECESVINDLAIETGLPQKQTLYPTKEYKKSRFRFFSRDVEDWEDDHGRDAEHVLVS